MKNLLLCGLPGCGKSTAIYAALKQRGLLSDCGGYRTLRVMSSAGKIRGFLHISADEERGVDLVTDSAVGGMFLDLERTPTFSPEIFRSFAEKSLLRPEKKLLLLDETGGGELLDPRVYELLLGALKGPCPCLGVLKSPEHAVLFSLETYRRFREEIERDTDTEIFCMDAEHRTEAAEHVDEWISEVIGT